MPRSTPAALLVALCALLNYAAIATAQPLPFHSFEPELAAQDATGKVWATSGRYNWALYSWHGDGWSTVPSPVGENYRPVALTSTAAGNVLCLWFNGQINVWSLSEHRGEESRLIANLDIKINQPRLFQDSTGTVWLTGSESNIYRIVPERGKVVTVKAPAYVIKPEQYHEAGRTGTYFNPVFAVEDGVGRVWFWSQTFNSPGNATLRGVLLFADNKFDHRPELKGIPDKPISWVMPIDKERMWLALHEVSGEGLYELNTQTFAVTAIPQPEQNAWYSIYHIFSHANDWYVVSRALRPLQRSTARTWRSKGEPGNGVLWRWRNNAWQKVAEGFDDHRIVNEDGQRRWLFTDDGMWVSANAGLILIPVNGDPVLFDWQQGYPLPTTNNLFKLNDGRILALSKGRGTTVFAGAQSFKGKQPSPRVLVSQTLRVAARDGHGNVWAIFEPATSHLKKWNGAEWSEYSLPENIASRNVGWLIVDSRNRIWLVLSGQGRTVIFDSVKNTWETFASYREALQAQAATGLSFLPSENNYILATFNSDGRICTFSDGLTTQYFDGKTWRSWKPTEIQEEYRLDGPPFFGRNGNLSVNVNRQTWQWTEANGWKKTTYEVQPTGWFSIYDNAWTNPFDTAKLPVGAPPDAPQPDDQSKARDEFGAFWYASRGRLIKLWGDRWATWLGAEDNHPFIVHPLLVAAFNGPNGNAVLGTGSAGHEFVIVAAPSVPPVSNLKATPDANGSVTLEFSTPTPGESHFTWRLDNGAWSTPVRQTQQRVHYLPSGTYRFQVVAIGPELQIDAAPAEALLEVRVEPDAQIAAMIAQLVSPDIENREAAVTGLVRQPKLALPALKKAREQAGGDKDKLWWIDAAIQQVEDTLRKTSPAPAANAVVE